MNRGQKREFHPEFFKNTLKINIGKNNISRKHVVDGLKLVIDLKKITTFVNIKVENSGTLHSLISTTQLI
jgi:hypothetical protein